MNCLLLQVDGTRESTTKGCHTVRCRGGEWFTFFVRRILNSTAYIKKDMLTTFPKLAILPGIPRNTLGKVYKHTSINWVYRGILKVMCCWIHLFTPLLISHVVTSLSTLFYCPYFSQTQKVWTAEVLAWSTIPLRVCVLFWRLQVQNNRKQQRV